MSADGWARCPRCGENEEGEDECTGVREEYEFFLDTQNDPVTFMARYYGRCVDCGWAFAYKHEETVSVDPVSICCKCGDEHKIKDMCGTYPETVWTCVGCANRRT